MRFARSRTISLLATVLLTALVFGLSCDTETVGPIPVNQPPVVNIVNIPPNNSHFTSNPLIYWYGTDVDGYIVSYEYLVIREDTLSNHGVDVNSTDQLRDYAQATSEEWTTVKVNQAESNPTRQTVRLYAGEDPADSVAQVFFVRAVDDDSARSVIELRVYSRNNNPPDTKVQLGGSSTVFWDLPDTLGNFKGIEIQWEGSDKIDYPSDIDKPTFEYYFQLFGPFDDVDTANLAETFDTTQVGKLILTAVDTATHSVWLKTDRTKVFNLWRNAPVSNATRVAWFVAKATARDDAFVSDPTPAYVAFKAIYPQFEKHLAIAVVTQCVSTPQVGNLLCLTATESTDPYPDTDRIETLKNFVYGVFSDAGYGDFDTLSGEVPAREILGQYRNVVVVNEGEQGSEISADYLNRMAEFMDLGGNVWLWAPSPFRSAINNPTTAQLERFTASDVVPVKYFDVQGQYNAAWKQSFLNWVSARGRTNEQFKRGLAIYGKGFNDFDIDTTKAWIYATAGYSVDWHGAPSTSYFVRDVFSEPLYLIDSYYGDFVPDSLKNYIESLQGKVVALRYDARTFKSAAFGFSMWMMYHDDAVDIIRKMITWFDN